MIKRQRDTIIRGNLRISCWLGTHEVRGLADGIGKGLRTIRPSNRQRKCAGDKGPRDCDGIICDSSNAVTDGNTFRWMIKRQGDCIVRDNLRTNCWLGTHEVRGLTDGIGKGLRTVCPSDCEFKRAGGKGTRDCDSIICDCKNAITDGNILRWMIKGQRDTIVWNKFRTACWFHTLQDRRGSDGFANMVRNKNQVKDIDLTITVDIRVDSQIFGECLAEESSDQHQIKDIYRPISINVSCPQGVNIRTFLGVTCC